MKARAAESIVIASKIHTAEDASPSLDALAIGGGRFLCVGSIDEVTALQGPSTEVLDLRRYAVLPGFVDAHLHLTNLGLTLEQADLSGVRSYDELLERTLSFASAMDDLWIVGRGWDQNLWDNKTFPTHHALSAIVADRPVALTRVDGHALLVNERALAIAGIDESTSDPAGGRILRDPNGKPNGVLIDAAQTLVYEKIPPPSQAQLVRSTRAAIAECNRWGITAVAEPGCDDAVLTAHGTLIAAGDYSIRNYAMLHDRPSLIDKHLRSGPIEAAHDGRLSVRAVKMYADGALGSRGAAMLVPYSDDPSNTGLILTPEDHLKDVSVRALRSGFQPCTHAIGDRANRMVLDAYESLLKELPDGRTLRPRIEHAQVVAGADVTRFAKLGVIPSMQASHALSDMPWAPARLGKRIGDAYAWRAILDSGSIVANGTDAPVERADTRRTFLASIAAPSAERAMTRREALASMTIWAAYASHQERDIGSIAPGKYADFVVLDRDWMSASADEIERSTILATYFAGRRIYASPACAF
jgi:predicted amidohydrolase YtcJ